MPQVLVWKCPHTGKLFEDQKKYKTHLRRQAVARREQRALDKFNAERETYWTTFRTSVASFADIEEFIRNNWEQFCMNGFNRRSFDTKAKFSMDKWPVLNSINLVGMRWTNEMSNSHSAPFGKEQNWGGQKKDVPRNYPGWHGRIEFNVTGDFPGFCSDIFEDTGLNTGSGGGGTNSYGYSLDMWADDFPTMYDLHEKAIVAKLVGFTEPA